MSGMASRSGALLCLGFSFFPRWVWSHGVAIAHGAAGGRAVGVMTIPHAIL